MYCYFYVTYYYDATGVDERDLGSGMIYNLMVPKNPMLLTPLNSQVTFLA